MSHAKQRRDKFCLNCNAVVNGRYCGVCGQENLEPQESFWHLVTHFFNDVTHFDGKFFSSLKYLILRPGFLSEEYVAGRRASYLNPVRMYIFTSAIFFLLYFSILSSAEVEGIHTNRGGKEADSVTAVMPGASLKISKPRGPAIAGKPITSNDYRDRKQYDSMVSAGLVKDNFFSRAWQRKQFSIKEKYGDDDELIVDKIKESFEHYTPEMFFISLPLCALFLQLLYMRRRKQFYYVSHIIFTIHLYVFVYIAALILLALYELSAMPYLHWLLPVVFILWVGVFFYAYRSMRNFYGQRRGKTFLKFVLLIGWLIFIIILLLLAMLFLSFFKL